MIMIVIMLMLMSNMMVMLIIKCKAMRFELRYDTYEVMTRKARGGFGNYTTIAL